MFSAAKDALTGAAARQFIGARIARYGTLRDLRIDSRRKSIDLTCELKGESEPITVAVGRYEIEQRDGRSYVRATGCTSNRPWIANLLEDFVEGRSFEVPPWAASAL